MASQIALQLYTMREFTKTPADIAKTLARVKKIGYDAVQSSALGPIDPAELAKILKNEGLTCCATHIGLDKMRDSTEQVIENHKLWGCEYTAIGGFFPKENLSTDLWNTFAKDFSDVAKKFAGSGVAIGYHNHSHELVKYDGKTALDILIDKCSHDVWFEIDTYWITHGGGDPIQWIKKVTGRIPCVHLKDMGITHDRQQLMREIGEGNLNFPGIIDACRQAGTKWFIIEQDNCNGLDPFDCVERSLKNLKSMGLS
jgi:sugar phosphate isomerase/epimerase